MSTEPIEPLLSVKEVQVILGVSWRTVMRELADGNLTKVKVRDRTMIAPDSLRRYISQRTVLSDDLR